MKKTILVTGGNGYIGTHAVHELFNQGYKVISIDDNSNSLNRHLLKEVEYYFQDYSKDNILDEIFSKHKIDAVLHFAASISVSESMENPEKYFNNNTNKTKYLLSKMKEHNIENIIFSSTAAVYGNPTNVPILEEDQKKPINPYGESKLLSELEIKKSNLKYIILRYFNVAGVYKGLGYKISSKPTHLIPSISKNILEKKPIVINGNDYKTKDGTAIRDYVHVQDLVLAHILSLKYLLQHQKSQEINLGTKNGYSVKEIVDIASKTLNVKIHIVYGPRRFGDPEKLIASNQKAKDIIGWENKFSLEEIIKSDYEWNKQFLDEKN